MHVDLNKLWKDLEESAREFASFGLAIGSKAVEAAAGTLTVVKDELARTAERLAPREPTAAPPSEASSAEPGGSDIKPAKPADPTP